MSERTLLTGGGPEESDSAAELPVVPAAKLRLSQRVVAALGFAALLLVGAALVFYAPESRNLVDIARHGFDSSEGDDGSIAYDDDEEDNEEVVEGMMEELITQYWNWTEYEDQVVAEQATWPVPEVNFSEPADCSSRFLVPEKMPLHGTQYNGVKLKDTCINDNIHQREEKGNVVFIIGDWGGINNGQGPQPADNTKSKGKNRALNFAVDRWAQQAVAHQFNMRARWRRPDYVLNVGDNFYWGGVDCWCGKPAWNQCDTSQFRWIYENVYKGPGVDGVQWLSVLGNHDYGGWQFNRGWDQAIAYSWKKHWYNTGRWVQPAQFYSATVHYNHNFSVDYFMVDTNVADAKPHWQDPNHNLCGVHNPWGASCGVEGPHNAYTCWIWFRKLWNKQKAWLEKNLALAANRSEWQIIVTHFPASYHSWYWKPLAEKYGIDVFVSGHRHEQFLVGPWTGWNPIKPSTLVISGGGGGVTSERYPNTWGWDDEYGFMDMTIWRDKLKIQAVSHGGKLRRTVWVHKRFPAPPTTTTTTLPGQNNSNSSHGSNNTNDTREDDDDAIQWPTQSSGSDSGDDVQ
eukprot:gb/GFBE01039584.1/.p1 GENE.gb/GFBE01039584.1/~~gb/GFBE01039584.1/.p1  ORF type:complete len:571 (+),score=105.94 gb/GFBE01039584.1/:1-1713(+)